ncbi:cell division protein DedD [Erwinia tracheiphila]|uniref:Cell division protein DedD n=1 Tax=Erwinia tracheiphila TaxID=65700 RepID=A0A0M2KE44_9GAMM|nr:cell division protein DedD [Erwinia tracheiphila]EOS96157.1 cell division protein DedD [Erwinia tracheiphila PSU-1]KKF35251.1 cell division protein DedD [Erwinia tracheiphila]UIA86912.1 cell division protein DedD [Erwinia tracheiphila]UIA95267.1 cell division protein DedD [Erwinia tracheiphila]
MASKFQNRLVGTVVIVALSVIVLPGLLDGKKKHYKEEFAAIPLVPKPGDQQETEALPPVTQALPVHPPEGAGTVVEGRNSGNTSQAESGSTVPQSASQPTLVTPPVPQAVQQKPVERAKSVEKNRQPDTAKVAPKLVEKPKMQPKVEPDVPQATEAPVDERSPAGQAYVVQLGALKNAGKVNEIVAKLRLSGYRAFTVPSTPVQGEITRIYVGPDASEAKMQASVAKLKELSELEGKVKVYSPR